jgi:CheY-like chemotaxis protein
MILIVDDSRADSRLTELWLRNSAAVQDVQVVRTGSAALEFLRREGADGQAQRPQLVLLDVHLPDILGWDLLKSLRADEKLRDIPVVVLTGTVNDGDMQLAKDLGAVRCLCKPIDADEFAAFVREIDAILQTLGER